MQDMVPFCKSIDIMIEIVVVFRQMYMTRDGFEFHLVNFPNPIAVTFHFHKLMEYTSLN